MDPDPDSDNDAIWAGLLMMLVGFVIAAVVTAGVWWIRFLYASG